MKLVSVILPTYNRASTLTRAIESVLAQDHRELELIVIDDGSTDNTAAIVQAIDDARLKYIRTERGGGSAARNIGLAEASGTFIAFQDSDDEWLPGKLRVQLAALEQYRDAGMSCISFDVHQGKTVDHYHWPDRLMEASIALHRITGGAGYPTASWLLRRDVWESCGGFDESLPRLQDYELTIRIAAKHAVVLSRHVGLTMHISSDSVSMSSDAYSRALDIVTEKHRDAFDENRRGLSHMIFRAGKFYALDGRYRDSLRRFWQSIQIYPASMRAWVGLALVGTGLFPLFRRIKYGR